MRLEGLHYAKKTENTKMVNKKRQEIIMTSLLILAIRMKVKAAVLVLWKVLAELDNGWEGGLKKDDSMDKCDNKINFGLKIDI